MGGFCKRNRYLSLLALSLAVLGCRQPSSFQNNSIVRLFPIGESLPLFESAYDEFEKLQGRPLSEITQSFFRININNLAKPGKIIPPEKTWSIDVQGLSPGKFVFSAFAVTRSPGPVFLKVTAKQAGKAVIQEEIRLKGRAIDYLKWEDFEFHSILEGSATISMECVFNDPRHRENAPWVFIGAPMFIADEREKEYPNIVLFIPDTLRADHIGCYGMPEPLTPTLDSLSRFSDLFKTVYGTSSWTRPTVNSIFTGLYPHRNKVLGAPFSQFHQEFRLLTEELAQLGFLTLGVSSNDLVSPIAEYDRGFDYFDSDPGLFARTNSTRQIQRAVMKLLPDMNDAPFFLYVHCMDPHDRYIPPGLFREMFPRPENSTLLRQNVQKGLATVTMNEVLDHDAPQITGEELAFLHSQYKGEVRFMDSMVGNIIRELVQRYPERSFIFMVMADHGEAFMEHGFLSHGFDLSQETIRVPWILSRLEPSQKPKVLAGNVSQVDVLSTVLGLLGKAPLYPTDGIDVYSAPEIPARTLYSFLGNSKDYSAYRRAVMRGDRKMVYLEDSPVLQYFLYKDPAEKNPVPVSESSTDFLYEDLKSVLANEPSGDGDFEEPEKVMQKLKALGYIH
ncbi:MAG: sulfatase [bacterium]